jgi:hypothetical protein
VAGERARGQKGSEADGSGQEMGVGGYITDTHLARPRKRSSSATRSRVPPSRLACALPPPSAYGSEPPDSHVSAVGLRSHDTHFARPRKRNYWLVPRVSRYHVVSVPAQPNRFSGAAVLPARSPPHTLLLTIRAELPVLSRGLPPSRSACALLRPSACSSDLPVNRGPAVGLCSHEPHFVAPRRRCSRRWLLALRPHPLATPLVRPERHSSSPNQPLLHSSTRS